MIAAFLVVWGSAAGMIIHGWVHFRRYRWCVHLSGSSA